MTTTKYTGLPVTPKMPEVKFNKNGYEIRTEILGMAKGLAEAEYNMKLYGWQLTANRDANTGQLITTVAAPEFPGLDKIMEMAERMYYFVNNQPQSKPDSK